MTAKLSMSEAASIRQAHFSLLRRAITTAGGHEVKSLGDGVMAVAKLYKLRSTCSDARLTTTVGHLSRSSCESAYPRARQPSKTATTSGIPW
jgi:hypothetical protein